VLVYLPLRFWPWLLISLPLVSALLALAELFAVACFFDVAASGLFVDGFFLAASGLFVAGFFVAASGLFDAVSGFFVVGGFAGFFAVAELFAADMFVAGFLLCCRRFYFWLLYRLFLRHCWWFLSTQTTFGHRLDPLDHEETSGADNGSQRSVHIFPFQPQSNPASVWRVEFHHTTPKHCCLTHKHQKTRAYNGGFHVLVDNLVL
jgi:hypothetical protein